MSSQKNASSPNKASSKQRANMITPTSSCSFPTTNTSPVGSSASSNPSRRKPKQSGSRSPPAQSHVESLSFQPILQPYNDKLTPKSRRSQPRNANNGLMKSSVAATRPAYSNRASPRQSAKRVSQAFASAKYLELPTTAIPAPPAHWLTVSEVADELEELLIAEPLSPTTAAAVNIATENSFDGRIRMSPLQLIAAVSA